MQKHQNEKNKQKHATLVINNLVALPQFKNCFVLTRAKNFLDGK
jgi:hypothetical protein